MNRKSIQQLRDESKSRTDRAAQLFQEAVKLFRAMQEANTFEEYTTKRNDWLEKDAEARSAVKESSDIFNQFIDELERFKKSNLN